jgi:hypothetical protein
MVWLGEHSYSRRRTSDSLRISGLLFRFLTLIVLDEVKVYLPNLEVKL